MPVYNLRKSSDVYFKTAGRLSKYYRDELALGNNNNIFYFFCWE